MRSFREHIRDEDKEFHQELCTWLDEYLPAFRAERQKNPGTQAETMKAWQRLCREHRWVGVSWPEEFGGRGASAARQAIVDLEFASRRTPQFASQTALERVGPALILHGTAEQRSHFLSRILSGEWVWCQGFSEPDAGSDLASLKTRAAPVSGGYRITGQKIWTSRAHISEMMWLLARTNVDAPKHHGLSAFIVDIKSPGITVRPIRQLIDNPDESAFCEVFLDEVFVPEFNLVGERDEGWSVARSTLVRERAGNANGFLRSLRSTLNIIDQILADELIQDTYGEVSSFRTRATNQEVVLAGLEALYERGLNSLLAGATSTGADTSIVKLLSSQLQQQVMELCLDIAGPYGEVMSPAEETFKGGNAALGYLRSRGSTIGGGTSEIQKNWIAEHILGLPKG